MEVDEFESSGTEEPIMSAKAYNLAIGLTLSWGFAVNWLMVTKIPPELISSMNPLVWWIGYFASCLLGTYLCNRSTNPLISFIGYNFVVIPFGLMINMAVGRYDASIVTEAIKITGLVTVGMMCLGVTFPEFFRKISGALTISLLLVIVVELVQVFIFGAHPGIMDWIVGLIFCGYIGYDWGRANQIPKTLDNAVDSAAELYIDIINLFLRILRIVSRR